MQINYRSVFKLSNPGQSVWSVRPIGQSNPGQSVRFSVRIQSVPSKARLNKNLRWSSNLRGYYFVLKLNQIIQKLTLDNVINVVPVKIEKEEEWIERKDPELSFSNTLQGWFIFFNFRTLSLFQRLWFKVYRL